MGDRYILRWRDRSGKQRTLSRYDRESLVDVAESLTRGVEQSTDVRLPPLPDETTPGWFLRATHDALREYRRLLMAGAPTTTLQQVRGYAQVARTLSQIAQPWETVAALTDTIERQTKHLTELRKNLTESHGARAVTVGASDAGLGRDSEPSGALC